MKRKLQGRVVNVVFLGRMYEMIAEEDRVLKSTLLENICHAELPKGEMSNLKLLDSVTSSGEELYEREGQINVEGINICYVKHWWKDFEESLLDYIEDEVRAVMLKKKTQKARRTATSEWTRSIGFSTQNWGARGHETRAPFSDEKGISSARLREHADKKIFGLVVEVLCLRFEEFGELFSKSGRIDLKYNSTIVRGSSHFDRKDVCHQVIFTLGSSKEGLIVEENKKETELQCHREPMAFDGRFQHWVAKWDVNGATTRDRIAVVCYLTDAPESFRHEKMTVEEIKEKYTTKVK